MAAVVASWVGNVELGAVVVAVGTGLLKVALPFVVQACSCLLLVVYHMFRFACNNYVFIGRLEQR